MTKDRNISIEHQREGDAKRPDDTLDRKQTEDSEVERSEGVLQKDSPEHQRAK